MPREGYYTALRFKAYSFKTFRSERDLELFNRYMLVITHVFSAIDILDFPDITIFRKPIENIIDVFSSVPVTTKNAHTLIELSALPFMDYEEDENIDRKALAEYRDTKHPIISYIWYEGIVPKVFELLQLSWPSTTLPERKIQRIVHKLRDAVHRHPWPIKYLEPAEVCCVCQEHCITCKFHLHCGHWTCHDCMMSWLATANTCPLCRKLVFWDHQG